MFLFDLVFLRHPEFISEEVAMEQTTPEHHTKEVDQDSPLQTRCEW